MKKNTQNYVNVGFGNLLQATLIILKLCGVISWSWVWVLFPLWMGIATVLVLGITLLVVKITKKNMKIKELLKNVDANDRIQIIAFDPKTEKDVVVFDGLPNIELLEDSVKKKKADLIYFSVDDDTGELVLKVVFQQKGE